MSRRVPKDCYVNRNNRIICPDRPRNGYQQRPRYSGNGYAPRTGSRLMSAGIALVVFIITTVIIYLGLLVMLK